MAGVKPPLPRAVPTLRFATVFATFLLMFSLATNALAPTFRQAASAPAYGIGGGGGGSDTEPQAPEAMSSAATEAPAEEETPEVAMAPATLVPTLEANRVLETPTPDASLKAMAPEQQLPAQTPQPGAASAPIPLAWEIGLLVIALISGVLAWLLRSTSERSWRTKTK